MFTDTAYAITSPNLGKLRFGTRPIFRRRRSAATARFLYITLLYVRDSCRQTQPFSPLKNWRKVCNWSWKKSEISVLMPSIDCRTWFIGRKVFPSASRKLLGGCATPENWTVCCHHINQPSLARSHSHNHPHISRTQHTGFIWKPNKTLSRLAFFFPNLLVAVMCVWEI